MIRRRRSEVPPDHSSSSDEEQDAFSALGRRRLAHKEGKRDSKPPSQKPDHYQRLEHVSEPSIGFKGDPTRDSIGSEKVKSNTSSMKRHHSEMKSKRKRRMDALIDELAHEHIRPAKHRQQSSVTRGSKVPPEQEHSTTNIFVANLCPSLSEVAVTRAFEVYGEIESVKVMWPRNGQEAARNRNTGFVCFQHRQDAERALHELDQTDPFRVGRILELDWGKMTSSHVESIHSGSSSALECRQKIIDDSEGDFKTGRQLERAASKRQRFDRLTDKQLAEFQRLCVDELVVSRPSICKAMAFCLEVSKAARHVSDLLQNLLLDEHNTSINFPFVASVETQIARLYLLSDILYNSQQPGIKNAFLYRDSIERMAPRVFRALGGSGDGNNHAAAGTSTMSHGRMTRNKLASAVRSVLGVWANWGVFPTNFLDELEAQFTGTSLASNCAIAKNGLACTSQDDKETPDAKVKLSAIEDLMTSEAHATARLSFPNGANQPHVGFIGKPEHAHDDSPREKGDYFDRHPIGNAEREPIDDAEEDPDGESLGEGDGADGELLDDNDADGEPLGDDDDADGEYLGDDDADGKPLGEDSEGEPLGEADDGEPLDDDDCADGEPL